ncbi:MAG: ABC transporter ATP-binding protein [Phycisphaerales bacterium]|nr:ABC transporter ATP-binding protein [Phycisphaerales bacterium]
MPALLVRGLDVGYPGQARSVVEAVSFKLPIGARLALVGPNGSGKSTLLKTIAGLLQPRSGEIRVFGLKVGACHHRTSYLPQREEINWEFPVSVERFVLAGRFVHCGWFALPNAEDRAQVDATLEELDLTSIRETAIGDLSGGQKQRIMLARAVAQGADLLLLDEPLNAVDVATRATVARVLTRLQGQGKSMIVSTHDLGLHDHPFDGVLALEGGSLQEVPYGMAP